MVLSFGTMAFAVPDDYEATNTKGIIIRTFDESIFPGMDISYTASGAPIVDDPNATIDNISL